jgi:hypothetical protein
MKSLVIIASILMSLGAAHAADMKADKQNVDTQCTADAATAGCGTEQVGTGLMKCLHAYKKAHKEYKFTDGCKSAMQQIHADKAATKKQ